MIDTENSEIKKNLSDKELLLRNTSFKRFAGGFGVYQELIQNTQDPNQKATIIERMHKFYTPNENLIDEEQQKIKSTTFHLIDTILQECQNGTFSSAGLADAIVSHQLSKLFLKEWNKTAGEVDKDLGLTYINETIAYSQNDNVISLHLRPTATEGSSLMKDIIAGLKIISDSFKNNTLIAEKIIMKSWLLSQAKKTKIIQKILGPDVFVRNVPSSDKDTDPTQHLAIQYNQPIMKRYLETGEIPTIGEIDMTQDEFIAAIDKL